MKKIQHLQNSDFFRANKTTKSSMKKLLSHLRFISKFICNISTKGNICEKLSQGWVDKVLIFLWSKIPYSIFQINSFHVAGLSPWKYQKTSSYLWFSEIFKGYRKRPVAWSGLRRPDRQIKFSERCWWHALRSDLCPGTWSVL